MQIIITKTESNSYLSEFSDWLALSDSVKDTQIRKASLYVQLKWICDSVDWADLTTVPEEVKEATAYYAYSSYSGTLFGTVAEDTPNGVKRVYSKVGSLEDEVEYKSASVGGERNSLGYPDSLMAFSSCSPASSSELIRS